MAEGFHDGFPDRVPIVPAEGLLDGFPDRAPIVPAATLEYFDASISRIKITIISTKLTQMVHYRSDYTQPLGPSKAFTISLESICPTFLGCSNERVMLVSRESC